MSRPISLLVAVVIEGLIYGDQNVTKKIPQWYVMDKCKYEEAEVGRLWDNEKNDLKSTPVGHFGFYFCEICHRLSLSETLQFVLYLWSR